MGFLSGSLTFERFRITDDPTDSFGDGHLGKLKKFRIGKAHSNLYETPAVGFTAGNHVLDTDFSYEKNVIGEALHFGIRVDSCAIPSPIKNAWMKMELAGGLEGGPGTKPTKAQRDAAKQAVEERCADEADKGNFRRMSETSVLWDAQSDTLFLGSTSEKNNDMCLDLIERVFGIETRRLGAGRLAMEHLVGSGNQEAFECYPTSFIPDSNGQVVWWNGMAENWDYLGNEFLLWLWWYWETKSDTVNLEDHSQVSGMFQRNLVLDCPKGEFGKETIASDSPVALPETALAIKLGKLPRKAGLALVRDGEQYDITLQAETFAINGARISQLGDTTVSFDGHVDRIESIRQMTETVDFLFRTFCDIRTSTDWTKEVKKISKWLQQD